MYSLRDIAYYSIMALSFVYGEVMAIRMFFQVEICRGIGNCSWVFDSMHPVFVWLIFIFIFLPFSPIITLLYAWPGYVLGLAVSWITKPRNPDSR